MNSLIAIIVFGVLFAITIIGLLKSNASAARLNMARQGSGTNHAHQTDASAFTDPGRP